MLSYPMDWTGNHLRSIFVMIQGFVVYKGCGYDVVLPLKRRPIAG